MTLVIVIQREVMDDAPEITTLATKDFPNLDLEEYGRGWARFWRDDIVMWVEEDYEHAD